MMKRLSVLLLLTVIFGCSIQSTEKVETFQAGYKTIQFKDETREYKPDSDTSDYLHYRPIDLDIWYPAEPDSEDTTASFSNLMGLLEKRANYYTNSEIGNGITQAIAESFTQAVQCSNPQQLLNFKTESYKEASPVKGKFPLIIYMASYNGMCYENFSLFEKLASEGYVVASINSIGRYPGDMTMKNADMMKQVEDALASIKVLRSEDNIDFSKVGVVGYSWGGLSGAVLANKMTDISCIISLDGSEFHHYGQADDEDADFNGIVSSLDFEGMSLNIPYLRLESNPEMSLDQKDSVYDFRQKLAGDQMILKVNSTDHGDFSCLPSFVRKSGKCESNDYYETITELTLSFLNENLKDTQSFKTLVDQKMDKSISMK